MPSFEIVQNDRAYRLTFTETTDQINNTSDVDITVECRGKQYGGNYGRYWLGGNVVITAPNYSKTISFSSGQYNAGSYHAVLNDNGTYVNLMDGASQAHFTAANIPHGDDGSCTLSFSFTTSMIPNSNATGTVFPITGTVSVDLKKINRSSQITIPSEAFIGNKVTINITNYLDGVKNTLTYSIGSTTGTIATKTTSTSVEFTVPSAFLNEFGSSDTEKTCTITCQTYYNNSALGNPSTGTVTIKYDKNNDDLKPSLSITVTPVNTGLPAALNGKFIQGYSKISVQFTASAVSGTIASKRFSIASATYNEGTEPIATVAGNSVVTATVTDSHGMTRTVYKTINVIPYSKPTIVPASGYASVIVSRCLENGTIDSAGTYLRLLFVASASSLDGLNTTTMQYKIGTGSWHITDGDDIETAYLLTTLSYTVTVKVSDLISSAEKTYDIPTDLVTFHLREGGNGAAFGKYSETEKVLELADDWDIRFQGQLLSDLLAGGGASYADADGMEF